MSDFDFHILVPLNFISNWVRKYYFITISRLNCNDFIKMIHLTITWSINWNFLSKILVYTSQEEVKIMYLSHYWLPLLLSAMIEEQCLIVCQLKLRNMKSFFQETINFTNLKFSHRNWTLWKTLTFQMSLQPLLEHHTQSHYPSSWECMKHMMWGKQLELLQVLWTAARSWEQLWKKMESLQ